MRCTTLAVQLASSWPSEARQGVARDPAGGGPQVDVGDRRPPAPAPDLRKIYIDKDAFDASVKATRRVSP